MLLPQHEPRRARSPVDQRDHRTLRRGPLEAAGGGGIADQLDVDLELVPPHAQGVDQALVLQKSHHVALRHRELRDEGDLALQVSELLGLRRRGRYVDLHALLELDAFPGRYEEHGLQRLVAFLDHRDLLPTLEQHAFVDRDVDHPSGEQAHDVGLGTGFTADVGEDLPLLHRVSGLDLDLGDDPRGLGHHSVESITMEQDAVVAGHLGRDGPEDAPDDRRPDEREQGDESQPAFGIDDPHEAVQLVGRQHLVHGLLPKQGLLGHAGSLLCPVTTFAVVGADPADPPEQRR